MHIISYLYAYCLVPCRAVSFEYVNSVRYVILVVAFCEGYVVFFPASLPGQATQA